MSVLVDTNVLLRRTQPNHEHHASAIDTVARLLAAGREGLRHANYARVVAAMNVHGVHRILTFNTGDFARFGIEVLLPSLAGA